MKISVPSDFYIFQDKFQDELDKATDWLIKSWDLKKEDKKIALLYRKKHTRKALYYLKKANVLLKDYVNKYK